MLHAEKALFWIDKKALLLSDVHLGKAQHFRKNGIPVSKGVTHKNLERCQSIIDQFSPERVIFLGDLFHSTYNHVWEIFTAFIYKHAGCSFHLIPGNHDILEEKEYQRAGIHLEPPAMEVGPFILSHQHIDDLPENKYCISGHIHPAIKLSGAGQQTMTLPCFIFRDHHALLPAFGSFTGLSRVKTGRGDRVYVLGDGQIVDVSPASSLDTFQ